MWYESRSNKGAQTSGRTSSKALKPIRPRARRLPGAFINCLPSHSATHFMLQLQKLAGALEASREEFRDYEQLRSADAKRYQAWLRELTGHTAAEVAAMVGAEIAPGALPSTELDQRREIGISFHHAWRSHEQARAWALDLLQERVTFAADGSQILPGRDISIPVAAVQIATFENPHRRTGEYVKDAELKIISPKNLLETEAVSENVYVAFCRFAAEVEAIKSFMTRHRGWRERGERMPLAFLDGTLQLQLTANNNGSSSGGAAPDYIGMLKELVLHSGETNVPVVGYVDQSYARDLVVLLNTIKGEARHNPSLLFDAQLLGADAVSSGENRGTLDGWGARTILFYSLRRGLVHDFTDEAMRPLVGFTYLQTVTNAAPARLDLPAWIYDAGLLDEVVDTVRAECVVGNGYPYPIETADAAAAISPEDRLKFVRCLGEFSHREQFDFRIARKRTSKNARR